MSTGSSPRPLALGIFRSRDRIFVTKAYDPVKDQIFYRPLGGVIEFGERGAESVARELKEEIGADVTDLRYISTLENIYTYAGSPGHEIILLYEGRFVDPAWYERDVEVGLEQLADRPLMRGIWVQLEEFDSDTPLYPDGLLDLLLSRQNENQ
ncbi:MAG TPA: NUDIX domain-containing protein [Chloroflexota bacterium]|nr:NUDIX domain-containing protein [Chloroflexota bacterium]